MVYWFFQEVINPGKIAEYQYALRRWFLKNVAVENTVFRYRALPRPNSTKSIKLAFISLVTEGTAL